MAASLTIDRLYRLPKRRIPLIGRDRDLADVSALVRAGHVALVTLTGPGGVGKTRLALQVAELVQDAFADGTVFIPLASVRDPGLVLPSIARAIGVRETAGAQLATVVAGTLAGHEMLMVIDNFEQVVDAAPILASLLADCPGLTILVTSRVRLQVSAEREYPVEPLPTRDLKGSPPFSRIVQSDAIRLFVTRARETSPAFALTEVNAAAVAEICRRLDGLPLAIELAAARTRLLTPEALRDRLQPLLPILVGGSYDLAEHQQTMHATIRWSYDLLSPTEQRFLRSMAVFAGGFTLDAFEEVCGVHATAALGTVDALSALVDNSLVRVSDITEGATRYSLLETVREFAQEALVASGEEATARRRHADWCLRYAAGSLPAYRQAIPPAAVSRLETEHANMRAALVWLDASGDVDGLMTLAAELGYFWYLAGHEAEGLDWLRRALARQPNHSGPHAIEVMLRAGHIAQTIRDPAARDMLREARAHAAAAGDILQAAHATLLLGILAEDSGEYVEARELLTSARAVAERVEHRWGIAIADYHLGVVALGLGGLDAARATLEAARAQAEAIDDLLIPMWCLPFLVLIACEEGRPAAAAVHLRQALASESTAGLQGWQNVLGSAAVLAVTIHQPMPASRLLGAAAAAFHDVPFSLPERAAFERAAASAERTLGPQRYADAWTSGRSMAIGEIGDQIDSLVAMTESTDMSDASRRGNALLTPREHEVLIQLIAGASNQEVADRLHISRRTVTTHVTSILAKFGVDTRAAAVSYAFQHDLV